jgi:hypothetical protein
VSYGSKGFRVGSCGEGTDLPSSVIDTRVEQREKRQLDLPTSACGHGDGVFGTNSKLDIVEKLCIFEKATIRVGDWGMAMR